MDGWEERMDRRLLRMDLAAGMDVLDAVGYGIWQSVDGIDDSDTANWETVRRAIRGLDLLSRAGGYLHHWREMGRADCEAAARVNHWAREHYS